MFQDDRKSALFDDGREYRYRLRRTWDIGKPTIAFIMLNPSTADATTNDPTVRRCIDYAKRWGYGTLLVGNIFALRSTEPQQLYEHAEPIGPENDEHLRLIHGEAKRTVAAWGANGTFGDRGETVAQMLDGNLHAFDTTKEGQPIHPLYQPKNADLSRYTIQSTQ